MTEDRLFQEGALEWYKAFVHMAMLGLSVTCVGYNVGAWLARRERHLAVNAVVYGFLAAYEARQIARHLR